MNLATAQDQISKISGLMALLSDTERAEIDDLLYDETPIWVPLPGPQTLAYESDADILYYGGSAGGGKTDLLLGLALNEHKHSIIYRRQTTQLVGIQMRLLEEILRSRKGWNGQTDILALPDRKIEFGSCNNAGDELKYQGRPHDFCVGEGTMVLMADRNYRPIESIIMGDYVWTLEGSKRVTAGARSRLDHAVSLSCGPIRQTQGVDHSSLTSGGWVSHDKFSSTHQPCSLSSSEGLQNSSSLYGQALHAQSQGLNRFLSLDTSHSSSLRWLSLPYLYQSLRAIFFSGHLSGLGTYFLTSLYRRAKALRHFLMIYLQAPQSLVLALSELYSNLEVDSVIYGDPEPRLLAGLRDYCLSYSHQYDGHVHPSSKDDLKGLLLQACAGQPIPNYSVGGGLGKTPKHSYHREWYAHPYTKEMRQIEADFAEAAYSFSPLGKVKLFDITVEHVNHYITSGGIVNKNCGFDEISHFLESQFRFLIGWLRTTIFGQRTRIVCAGNPPLNPEGRWVIKYWGPWLDDKHPKPARSGELRWFTTVDGRDEEVPDGKPIIINGRTVIPMSRTFIPSSVQDNPFLLKTGYESTLQALPEPLRSQMLLGDFKAGVEDSAWQLIPTDWIDAAMERWTEEGKKGPMDSAGVDVARGGRDKTVVSTRHGAWYDRIKALPGAQTPNGAAAAGFVVSCIRDKAVVHVDALGVGGETIGHLETNGIQVDAVVGYDTDSCLGQYDKATGRLRFRNRRALIHWRFRESLDPVTGDKIALPPDPELKADLCAPLWKLTAGGILVEEKDEIKKRIGRSPDKGDAVIYASICTPKTEVFKPGQKNVTEAEEWSPFDA